MNYTIGIIVPMYGVAKYLSQCLDSVITQSYQNLSILLVSDGDDSCLEIALKYAKKDSRIIVIDKQNGGQSTARNVGLEFFSKEYVLECNLSKHLDPMVEPLLHYSVTNTNPYEIKAVYVSRNYTDLESKSKQTPPARLEIPHIDYIIFLDSDDYWRLDCIELCVRAFLESTNITAKKPELNPLLKNKLENNLENKLENKNLDSQNQKKCNTEHDNLYIAPQIVWFDFEYFYDGVEQGARPPVSYHELYGFTRSQRFQTQDLLEKSVEKGIQTFPFVVQGMIDFSYIKRIKIRFLDRIFSEDQHFGILLLIQSENFYVISEKPYVYRIRFNSSSNFEGKKRLKKESIFPYLQDMYMAFGKDVRRTKGYFIASSWFIIFESMLFFLHNYENYGEGWADSKKIRGKIISDVDSKNIEKLEHLKKATLAKKAFLPYIAYMATSVAKYPRDPLCLIPKLAITKPFLDKSKLKIYRKIAVYNPRIYSFLRIFILFFIMLTNMFRKIRKD